MEIFFFFGIFGFLEDGVVATCDNGVKTEMAQLETKIKKKREISNTKTEPDVFCF